MMRTTINLPDDLFREVKKHAHATGRTFTDVVQDAIREALARKIQRNTSRAGVRLPVSRGAPQPGVDLDDSAALLELMDDDDSV